MSGRIRSRARHLLGIINRGSQEVPPPRCERCGTKLHKIEPDRRDIGCDLCRNAPSPLLDTLARMGPSSRLQRAMDEVRADLRERGRPES